MKEIFEQIYEKNVWSISEKRRYFSGGGSLPENLQQYSQVISSFLLEKNIKKVVDIGCGDWNAGNSIQWRDTKVIACDIVKEVIEENKKLFKFDNIDFRVLNAHEDPLPEGELCIIKQVFQHLSNDAIITILERVKIYKYVIITDSASTNKSLWYVNEDKPTNNHIRKNGLFLECPPFNITNSKILLEYPTANNLEILRMMLMEN